MASGKRKLTLRIVTQEEVDKERKAKYKSKSKDKKTKEKSKASMTKDPNLQMRSP